MEFVNLYVYARSLLSSSFQTEIGFFFARVSKSDQQALSSPPWDKKYIYLVFLLPGTELPKPLEFPE